MGYQDKPARTRKPSKTVTRRVSAAAKVAQAGNTHDAAVQQGAEAFLGDMLAPGTAPPDLKLLVQLAARKLGVLSDALDAADVAHAAELDDDTESRRARDAESTAVRAGLTRAQQVVLGTYGPAGIEALKLSGPLPESPREVLRYGETVVAALQTTTLPASTTPGVTIDTSALGTLLGAHTARLRTALEAVDREAREAEATQRAKNLALDALRDGYRRVATLYVGLLVFAGMDDVAAKVRPTVAAAAAIDDGATADETVDAQS